MSTLDHSFHPVRRDPVPDPVCYEKSIYQKGLNYERPPFTFLSSNWESRASDVLSATSKGYLIGNAGTGETARKNTDAFKKWSIVPKRLLQTKGLPALQTTIFGEELQFPIAAAPVGVQRIFHPDGEEAAARAAAENSIPYILSTASSTSIEDVAKANGTGVRWFQLYWPDNEFSDITISMLNRAKKAGYTALVVTLDTYILGWRPSDMDNGYNPFLRSDQIGTAIGLTDQVFRRMFKEEHGVECEEKLSEAAATWARMIFPGQSHSWEDVKILQAHWDGPVILKGIQSVEDARMAAQIGVQGIVVSNHGGRQVDGGVSSLGVLPRIVDAVRACGGNDKIEILFDSGVRCGADIAKALALGADMVLVGRPYIYGLALGGQAGVGHILKSLLGELELTLHLAGISSVDKEHLNRDVLVKEADLF
ncbi:FMN-dependent dehydrogenase [Microdochium trichocladiopsis]|uniref:FMN-dependent dehydrogenase n=1 Tax=Microdochium trichocladiopsis TaxID=1682393 RepID=A0A9P8Y545_9PEZI|nr:FMN-dependent dehydrogenase [Microdochium trichocladiopsis]KAH7029539.1 FMN-dependent dehydrogenase [Microdochium trichocladiopsis]